MYSVCQPFRTALLVGAALVSFSVQARAQQVSGSIGGTVVDRQGAIVPGAKITLTDVNQGDVRESTTNSGGVFFLNPLKPSVYNLRVDAAGFRSYEHKDIKVFANDRIDLGRLELEVGGVSETIFVEAQAVALKTQ